MHERERLNRRAERGKKSASPGECFTKALEVIFGAELRQTQLREDLRHRRRSLHGAKDSLEPATCELCPLGVPRRTLHVSHR